jgi:hypothetical protein
LNECLKAALEYESMGYSVIPCNPSEEEEKGKKPFIKWERYQKERAAPEQIKEWWAKWPAAMIGIVTGEISGIFVVDADSEAAKEKIEELLPENFEGPMVKTPRPGYHYYFANHKGILNSNNGVFHVRGSGGFVIAPPSKRSNGLTYSWQIPLKKSLPPPAPPLSLLNIININALQRGKTEEKERNETSRSVTSVTISFDKGSRDESLFHLANQLVKSGESRENILYLLENIAIKVCNPPFPIKEIPIKIQSAFDRTHLRERNWQVEVEEWISVTKRNWSVTEVQRDVTSVTKQDKAAVRMAVKRLKDSGIIEPVTSKSGVYRRVDNTVEEIDIFSDTDNPLNIKYPLGIESFVRTMPKSIVVIAGESDAGKTAFLLNFSSLNLDYYPITYFSSEMGPTELKDRISKFSRPITDWKKILFKERGSNFQDVIEPDKINIIDYLELADDFYKVGGQIKAIFDKLNKGIALIALQKKIGSELARGGDFTMEKARLYITLSRDNICKIIKAKNWVNSMVKPTGKQRKYILLHGCEFRTKSNWEMEGQENEAV